MYFKNLYLKKSGKLYRGEYLDSPVSYNQFKEAVKDVPNLNIGYIEDFYIKYVNELFPEITSKEYKSYSKYFWRFKSLGLTATSSSNDEYWLERGWSLEQIKEKKKEKFSTHSEEFYLNKGYSEEEAKALFRKKVINNVIKSKITKKLTGNYGGYSLEYYIKKGYSEKEAIAKIKNINYKNSESTKEAYKDPTKYVDFSPNTTLKYYIKKGYSEKEAKSIVSERQRTFSLEKCIEKYGKEKGQKTFNERQKKWKKSLYENFKKYGDGRSPQSKWASEIITKLCKELKIQRPKKEKWISSGDLACSYDFTYNNKIIEFNGDYWHLNPNIYNYTYYNKNLESYAIDKWADDFEKINLAKSKGYNVLVIWESDYNKNPNLIIKKCLNFLNSN